MNFLDEFGLCPSGSDAQAAFSTWDGNTATGSVDEFYYSKEGPAANGAKLAWVTAKNDTTNGAAISGSAGLISLDGQTNTPVFIGGAFDVATVSGQIALTNDGVSLSAGASAISLAGKIGFQANAGNYQASASVEGSIGFQAGFEVEITNSSVILDVAFIFGGKVEVDWGKKDSRK